MVAIRIHVVLDRETKSLLQRQAEAMESIAETLKAIEKDLAKPVVDALNTSFDPPAPQ